MKALLLTFTTPRGCALSKAILTLTRKAINFIDTGPILPTGVINTVISICVQQGVQHYSYMYSFTMSPLPLWYDLTRTLRDCTSVLMDVTFYRYMHRYIHICTLYMRKHYMEVKKFIL